MTRDGFCARREFEFQPTIDSSLLDISVIARTAAGERTEACEGSAPNNSPPRGSDTEPRASVKQFIPPDNCTICGLFNTLADYMTERIGCDQHEIWGSIQKLSPTFDRRGKSGEVFSMK